jgi:hypothetical protein
VTARRRYGHLLHRFRDDLTKKLSGFETKLTFRPSRGSCGRVKERQERRQEHQPLQRAQFGVNRVLHQLVQPERAEDSLSSSAAIGLTVENGVPEALRQARIAGATGYFGGEEAEMEFGRGGGGLVRV